MNTNDKFKRASFAGAAFAISIFTLLIIYYRCGLLPFGDNTMLVWDMKLQYAAFMSWYMDVLHGKTSFLYSLNGGLGGSTIGLFAYYLASPLNLLLIFYKLETIPFGITLIMILKVGISATSMQKLLYYRHESCFSIVFACLYALSSFAVCFQYNTMWMDAYMLLPLVILFLDRLIHNEKGIWYSIILAISIATNYYIGFMVCLFCVIYFASTVFTQSDEDGVTNRTWKNQCMLFGRFAGFSILGGGLSACVILPGVLTLKNSSSGRIISFGELFDFERMFDPIREFRYVLPGMFDEHQGISGRYPMIYAGILTALGVILFFFLRKINIRHKIRYGIMLVLLYIGMLFKGPFLMWHGFCKPSGCYERAAFIWVMVVVDMAYIAWSIVFSRVKEKKETILFAVIILLCVAETSFNGVRLHRVQFSELYSSMNEYSGYIDEYRELNSKVSNEEVYRTVVFSGFGDSYNMGYMLGINGINQYSSAESENTWNIYGALGMGAPRKESDIEYDAQEDALIADILGVRYVYEELMWDVFGYEKIATTERTGLYENADALPIGFVVTNYEVVESDNLFEVQNSIYHNLYGSDDGKEAYIVTGVDEEFLDSKEDYELGKMPQIFKIGDGIYTDGWYVASEDKEVISSAVKQCKACTKNISLYEGEYVISGNFEIPKMDKPLYICFSIPYDENMSIYVDGMRTEGFSGMGGMLVVPVSEGDHEIGIKFTTPGLSLGVCLTILSALILTLTLFDDKIKRICFRRNQ